MTGPPGARRNFAPAPRVRPEDDGFLRNKQRRSEANLVIVDEASMIDTVLAYESLKADPGLPAILVGDVDQLPSVGPGSVLKNIIRSTR